MKTLYRIKVLEKFTFKKVFVKSSKVLVSEDKALIDTKVDELKTNFQAEHDMKNSKWIERKNPLSEDITYELYDEKSDGVEIFVDVYFIDDNSTINEDLSIRENSLKINKDIFSEIKKSNIKEVV